MKIPSLKKEDSRTFPKRPFENPPCVMSYQYSLTPSTATTTTTKPPTITITITIIIITIATKVSPQMRAYTTVMYLQ